MGDIVVELDRRRAIQQIIALAAPGDTVLVAGRVVKRAGKLLYTQLEEKKAALQKSGERILTDFGLLPQRAA